METLELRYSEHQIKQAMRAYFQKKIGVLLPVVMLFLTAFVIYCLIQGNRTWYVGFIGALVGFAVVLFVSSYATHLQRSLLRFKRMKTPVATMEISSEQFRVQSDVGATEMKWSHITQVQCLPDSWLLFFAGNDFMTLPLEGLSEESKQLILRVAESNGAQIT